MDPHHRCFSRFVFCFPFAGRRIWNCVFCGHCEKGNNDTLAWNKPGTCCCGCCNDTHCCNRRCLAFRKNWCMVKCCDNNCIVDPCALCWGEYKGNIMIAENELNAEDAREDAEAAAAKADGAAGAAVAPEPEGGMER